MTAASWEGDRSELAAGLYAVRDAAKRGADALNQLRQVADEVTREFGADVNEEEGDD